MNQLNKYKIGLGIIGAFSLILLVLVLLQASGTKQDNETYEKASEVAGKLDDYVISNGIPESLQDAGIRQVPEEVSYQKLSEERYKFCVTYKTKSSGFNSNEIWYTVATGSSASSYETDTEDESSYLNISSVHDKGENCQTVYDPYAGDTDNYNFDDYDYQNSEFLEN